MRSAAFGLRRSNQHAAAQGAGGAHADVEVAVRRPELSDPVFYDGAADRYDNARGQTSQARLHDAEAALDAVRRKFGNKAAQFGA